MNALTSLFSPIYEQKHTHFTTASEVHGFLSFFLYSDGGGGGGLGERGGGEDLQSFAIRGPLIRVIWSTHSREAILDRAG